MPFWCVDRTGARRAGPGDFEADAQRHGIQVSGGLGFDDVVHLTDVAAALKFRETCPGWAVQWFDDDAVLSG